LLVDQEVQDEHERWSDVVDEEETGGMTAAAGAVMGYALVQHWVRLHEREDEPCSSTTTTAIYVLRCVVTDLMADIREYDRNA
jgi:hypothetical protein